jgi:hypothetical protein
MYEFLAGRLAGILAELAEKFAESAIVKELAPRFLARLAAFLLGVAMFLDERVLNALKLPLKIVLDFGAVLLLPFLQNDPKTRAAALEMYGVLEEALVTDYLVAATILILGLLFPLLFVGIVLLCKLLTRPELNVFISFSRAREVISENLQKTFELAGALVFRLPFRENATHQDVVVGVAEGIRRCNGFVCLPGHALSFVESEVLAAATSEKLIVFVISETLGATLPETSDKRYPVFRLETAASEQFKSIVEFLSYVGADFRSTRKLCQQALLHPYVQVAGGTALFIGSLCFLSLLAYCYYRVNVVVPNLTNGASQFAMVERPVRLAHFGIYAVLASVAGLSFLYSSLFGSTLVRQFKARNRARLRTIAAQFNRDDWIGVIPGLSPGTNMYECLFAAAPLAHHEAARKAGA